MMLGPLGLPEVLYNMVSPNFSSMHLATEFPPSLLCKTNQCATALLLLGTINQCGVLLEPLGSSMEGPRHLGFNKGCQASCWHSGNIWEQEFWWLTFQSQSRSLGGAAGPCKQGASCTVGLGGDRKGWLTGEEGVFLRQPTISPVCQGSSSRTDNSQPSTSACHEGVHCQFKPNQREI